MTRLSNRATSASDDGSQAAAAGGGLAGETGGGAVTTMGGEARGATGAEAHSERCVEISGGGSPQRWRRGASAAASMAVIGPLALGCDPVIDVAGSFLPAWMPCLAVGGAFAALSQVLFARLGLEPHLGPRPVVYTCLGALGTMTTWLVFFRP